MGDDQPSTDPLRGRYDVMHQAWEAVEASHAKSGLSDETLLLIQKYAELIIRIYGYDFTPENLQGITQSSVYSLTHPVTSTEFDQNSAIYIDLNVRATGAQTQRAIVGGTAKEGSQGNTHKSGDPVELFSGEFVHRCDDLLVKGAGMDFVFRRTYRNQVRYDGPLGANWDHLYNVWIWRWSAGNTLIRSTGDLREEVYRRHPKFGQAGFSYWVPPNGQTATIAEEGTSFVWTAADGTRQIFEHDLEVPAYHRLAKIEDPFGNHLAFTYQGRRLLTVEVNHPDRLLTFGYDDLDRITTITDFMGRTWSYCYDDTNDLVGVTAPESDDFPKGVTTRYEYSSASESAGLQHNLLRVFDPAGRCLVENEFGRERGMLQFGRVVRQRVGGGSSTFEYELVVPEFDFEYSDADRPAIQVNHIDPHGHVLHYLYNRFGNLLLREESVLEGGREKLIQSRARYNGDGALIALHAPEGSVTQYYYGRDHFLAVHGIPDADVPTHDALTEAERRSFHNLLAVVRRAGRIPNPAFSYPHGFWGDYLPAVTDLPDPGDIVAKYTYGLDRVRILTSSDPRFTRSADPNFPEGPDYHRTLTRFHYDGPPGDPFLLLVGIEHPDFTLPDGTTVSNVRDDFPAYDARGRLVERRDRDGTVTRFEYFGPGSGTREGFTSSVTLDPGGLAITNRFALNPAGLVIEIRHPKSVGSPPGSFTSRLEYDEFDQIVRKIATAPFGFETRAIYDECGLPVRTESDLVDETGAPLLGGRAVQTFAYDEIGEIVSQSSGGLDEGTHLVSRYEYGSAGELLSLFTPAGRRIDFDYDPRLNIRATTRGVGSQHASTSRAEHDSDDRITAFITGRGSRTSYTYDAFGRIERIEDPLGNITALSYDKSGNIVVERLFEPRPTGYVLLKRSEYEYDELHQRIRETMNEFPEPLAVTDVATAHLASPGPGTARTTQYFHDRKGRIVRVVNPAGEETLTEYDAADRVVATQDPMGNRLEQRFDKHGNLVRSVRREPVRDPVTNAVVGEDVFPQDFAYDELDRLVERRSSLGNVVQYFYDSRSQVVRVVDQLGNTSRCRYDVHGRKVSDLREQTDTGLGNGVPLETIVTGHEYDADSNITAAVDGNGNRIEQVYDELGRRAAVTFPDGSTFRTEFDADDNATMTIDANGLRRRFRYDALGRVVRMDVDRSLVPPTLTVGGEDFEQFAYDGAGRVVSEENTFARIATKVDSLGRPYEEELHISSPELTAPFRIAREFDAVGRTRRLTYPSNRVVEYGRDPAGRIVRVANATKGDAYQGSGAFPDQYEIISRALRGARPGAVLFGNGATSRLRYDGAARPIEFDFRDRIGAPLLTVQQLYDAAGNLRFRTSLVPGTQRTEALRYDSLARLTTIDASGPAAVFDPTLLAPLATEPPGQIPHRQDAIDSVIGALGQVPAASTFRYDGASNRTEERRTGQPPLDYASNPLNEYTAIGPQPLSYDNNGNLRESDAFSLVYDCRNLLTGVTDKTTGASIEFLHDARGRRVGELRADAVTHLIQDDLNLIEEYENGAPVRQYVHTGDVDSYCQVAQNGAELWCHTDQFGSPRVLTGPSGAEAGTASYDPFGVTATRTGVALPIGFAGRRFDEAGGMYDFRSREYAPTLGRFLQRDSLGMTVAANLYQYALDNPLRYIDPFGTEPGWLRKTVSRFAGGAWGALRSFGNFLRLGLWDSWAQSFSSSSRERILGAQQWFGELYDAVDEGRFLAWTEEGLDARMHAIVEAEERGDYFGSAEIFGDTAFTAYGVYKGGTGALRGGLRFGGNVRAYGLLDATKGIGYSLRHWSTTYRGIGLTRASIAETQFGTVRGSPYANYETYLGAREISRLTWQAERSIGRGGNNDIRSVRTYRRFAGTNAAPRFYGTAVNRVVDQALSRSGDPFLSTTIIRQGAFGINAKGNPIFPDYRIPINNQTVIDITTVRQAGKAAQYPAANAIEPYTGTVRYPEGFFPPAPPSSPDEGSGSSE